MFNYLDDGLFETKLKNKKTVKRLLDKYGTLDNFKQNSTLMEDFEYQFAQGDDVVDELERERQAMMQAMNRLSKQQGTSLDDGDMNVNASVYRAKNSNSFDDITTGLSQDFLDISYGINRGLNGVTAGGLDYLGDKYGFDSRMNNYLNLLSSDERKQREQIGSLVEIGGNALLADKMIRSVLMLGDEIVRMRGRRDLIKQLKRGHDFRDVNFGKVNRDTLSEVNKLRSEEGFDELSGNAFIPANVIRKFVEKRLQENYTPEQIAEMGKNLFHKRGVNVRESKYPHIQEVSRQIKSKKEVGYISRDPITEKTVIKSIYKK